MLFSNSGRMCAVQKLRLIPFTSAVLLTCMQGESVCGVCVELYSPESPTLPTRAGMFIELVAKPIPKVMEDSTPRNPATSSSSSSCMLRLPAGITGWHLQVIPFDLGDGITGTTVK